ncbi:MarR family protein [Pseudovibrio sp. Ad46]|uniref:helix-turn-helix domain-containing protein n=1 Tax=Pseudovibrio sp. Ad46 TaxID=989432 RepID=UPI0007AEBA65|nr:helix-turn-helix domain-containing protein [Pseudovibrio sp. Ad46]KZK80077.1 MarR family protein [Pseudovibrio sp. Ad46]
MRDFQNVQEWLYEVSQSDLAANTRLMLFALSLFADRSGEGITASIGTLAERTGLSKPSVIKHLKSAEGAGWICVKRDEANGARIKRNEYSLKLPDVGGAA